MNFICYIDRQDSDTPHMEPLVAKDLDAARVEAGAMLTFYDSGIAARIFHGDVEMARVARVL